LQGCWQRRRSEYRSLKAGAVVALAEPAAALEPEREQVGPLGQAQRGQQVALPPVAPVT
jgi:hypothetical protein